MRLQPELTTRRASIWRMFPSQRSAATAFVFTLALAAVHTAQAQSSAASSAAPAGDNIVLHAAHILDVEHVILVSPGEVLVRGNRIVEVGSSVAHPSGATVIDLGAATLMPGLIDAHVHLFLHPGAEDQIGRASCRERV